MKYTDNAKQVAIWGDIENNNDVPLSQFRELTSGACGKCLDTEGANVQIEACNGSDSQKWYYDSSNGYLFNKLGVCLDSGSQIGNNGTIEISQCANLDSQHFDFLANTIRLGADNTIVIDAYGTQNGSNVGQWTTHGGLNQQWNWGSN